MSIDSPNEQPWAVMAKVPAASVRPSATASNVVVSPQDRRLSLLLFLTAPVPIGGSEDAAWCWFQLMEALSEPRDKDGLTAKQLAAREGIDQPRYLVDLLDRLADAGDLVATRKGGGPARYRAQPLLKSLTRHLAAHLQKGKGDGAWEALALAALAYEDDPRQALCVRIVAAQIEHAKMAGGSEVTQWVGTAKNTRIAQWHVCFRRKMLPWRKLRAS